MNNAIDVTGHELTGTGLPFAEYDPYLIHRGRQCLDTWSWHAQCAGQPVWLCGGTINCPACLDWIAGQSDGVQYGQPR